MNKFHHQKWNFNAIWNRLFTYFFKAMKKINIGTKLTIVSVYKLLFVRKKENKKQRCIKNSLLQKLLAKFFLYSSLNISDFRKLSRATSQFCIKRKKVFYHSRCVDWYTNMVSRRQWDLIHMSLIYSDVVFLGNGFFQVFCVASQIQLPIMMAHRHLLKMSTSHPKVQKIIALKQ